MLRISGIQNNPVQLETGSDLIALQTGKCNL